MARNTCHHHTQQDTKLTDSLRYLLGHFHADCPDGRSQRHAGQAVTAIPRFCHQFGFLGTNLTSKAYKGFQQGRYWDLENKDVERIRRNVDEVDIVTPSLAKWGINAVYQDKKISGTLKGLYPEYGQIEEPQITMGRYLNDMDIRDQRKVCVIGKRIYETLFPGGEDPCGNYIEVNGIYYRVIGVSMASGNISIQGRSETSIIIPFSTMQNNYNFGQKIQLLCYTARRGYSISEVEKKVAQVVKKLTSSIRTTSRHSSK